MNADNNIRCKIWLDHGAAYDWYYDVITSSNTQSVLLQYSDNFVQSVFVDYIIGILPFSSNYILNIGASTLLSMLLDNCNPTSSKENFLEAYMNINPNNSSGKYVCGTMATLVDYYSIVLKPIDGSERDIMGYEYDDSNCFYGLPYYRGEFYLKYN